MGYLEIINVRLARPEALETTLQLCREILSSEAQQTFRLFRSSAFQSDLSIHLWPNQSDGQSLSALGLSLSRLLMDYGLINHELWQELQ